MPCVEPTDGAVHRPDIGGFVLTEHRAGVEGDPNPGDTAVLDMGPVDDCHGLRAGGAQLEPGQHVWPVDPAVNHLHMLGDGKHAGKAAERVHASK